MKIHVATITDARRRTNEAFDSVLILFDIPISETDTKTYKLEMVNNSFLLNKLFSFTGTFSGNINDLIGKSIRVCLRSKCAIGHPTENCFVLLNLDREFKMEDLEEQL